ncbi:hypothetical protein AzCIB_0516 [Azoarcus sp. CIB]|nr:hypothetical protein AzCIB_0516 [Azoarcus sp. CIB]
MRQQRGRRGVADAHLAEADHVAAVRGQRVRELASAGERRVGLLGAHRRFFQIVRGARPELRIDEPRALAEFVIHAAVDDGEPQAQLTAEDVDRCAAGEEILDHLPGDVLWEGGNARACRAVVAGEDHHVGLAELGAERLLDQAELQRQRLQAAEGALRLGLVVDAVLEVGRERAVGRADLECHDCSMHVP